MQAIHLAFLFGLVIEKHMDETATHVRRWRYWRRSWERRRWRPGTPSPALS
jgi:hypothetical protein